MRPYGVSGIVSMTGFTCNICGARNPLPAQPLAREEPSCTACGSSVRMRGLLQTLSMELFGLNLGLPDFPRVRSLRGLGLSDASEYAERLAAKFDYRNTFYDRPPRFDVSDPAAGETGAYDFIVASEVFEHVPPPVEAAFANIARLLKPSGVLVFTVPYSLDSATVEHFPELREFGLAQAGGRAVLVNRSASGELSATDRLVFHVGCRGPALEMREFSEAGLKAMLGGAGFTEVRFRPEPCAEFGVVPAEQWSLPVAARRGAFAWPVDAAREVVEQWRDGHREIHRLGHAFWFRLGRKLGLI